MMPVAVLDQKVEHSGVHQVQQPAGLQQGTDMTAKVTLLLPPGGEKQDMTAKVTLLLPPEGKKQDMTAKVSVLLPPEGRSRI